MGTTTDKLLPLGKPRATAYLAILEKRLGKRKATAIEKKARELAVEAGQRVVRFEFVALAADVPLQQMVDELSAEGIRTSVKDVRFGKIEAKAKTNGKPKTEAKAAGKGGQGNGRKATGKKASSPKLDETLTKVAASKAPAKREAKADPKSKPATRRGSAKPKSSSRKAPARAGRAASSSGSKTAAMRRQREQKVSTPQ